jgi:hypothetical protein
MKGMAELRSVLDQRLTEMEERLVETRIIDISTNIRQLRDSLARELRMQRIPTPAEVISSAEKLMNDAQTAPPEESRKLYAQAAAMLRYFRELTATKEEEERQQDTGELDRSADFSF